MADCKRKTANLFSDKLVGMTWWDGVITADERFTLHIAEVKPNMEYTASGNNSVDNIMVTYYSVYPAEGQSSVESVRYVYPTNPTRSVATFTTPDDSRIKYAAVRFGSDATDVMFNLGSTAFPYEPYWESMPVRKYNGTIWVESVAKKWDGDVWIPATSWTDFRDIIRAGKAPELYPVGTILYDVWGDTTSKALQIVAYDKHFDNDLTAQGYTHSVTLCEEKLTIRQFDAAEAWLYADTEIPSGTYRFKIPNYDTTYGGNKTYIFTSTATVPVGGQLTLTWAYNQNPSAVQAYSSNTSTSAIFNVSIAEWDGETPCTDLGTIKLAMSDADSTYGKLNHIHRVRYGSNNYWQSGVRQYLNSDSAANTWWQPTTVFDRSYSNRSVAGYLTTLNSDFKGMLALPNIQTVANNLFETTGYDGKSFTLNTAYDIKDKIFLLSHTEVNLSTSPNVGSVLDYYDNATNAKRIKYRADNGDAYYWWLRTPYPTGAYYVRGVNTTGALSGSTASGSIGVAAACIIQ